MKSPDPIRLGFVPLNDAAALMVARDLGFFEREGLVVELSREASWATIRDKMGAGLFEGAHMLAPLALAMSLGLECDSTPILTPFALNIGGAAITLAAHLHAVIGEDTGAGGLADLIRRRADQGASRLTFGTVFPFSLHSYLLRAWLADAGLDPDTDVRLTIVPPSRTAELLSEGVIEGFCVGEPWSQAAASRGVGKIVARVAELEPNAPDKVLATTQAWAERDPESLCALVRALDRASAWIAAPQNRSELVRVLAEPGAVGLDSDLISASLAGIRFPRAGGESARGVSGGSPARVDAALEADPTESRHVRLGAPRLPR